MNCNRDRIISLVRAAEEIAHDNGQPVSDTTGLLLEIEYHGNRSARAGEKASGDETGRAEKRERAEADKVENIARDLGLSVTWPGLYPVFRDRLGHSVSWIWG